jgi:hypothetical protein
MINWTVCIRRHDIKIIMGDKNAKVGKDMRVHNVGGHSLHEVSNDKGKRLTDFAVIMAISMLDPSKGQT